MRMNHATLYCTAFSIVSLLNGCATAAVYPAFAEQQIECASAYACARTWQRVQVWLATSAPYRLAVTNDTVLQTYGPTNYSLVPGYTVTKITQADGTGVISILARCDARFGPGLKSCLYDPAPHAAKLAAAALDN